MYQRKAKKFQDLKNAHAFSLFFMYKYKCIHESLSWWGLPVAPHIQLCGQTGCTHSWCTHKVHTVQTVLWTPSPAPLSHALSCPPLPLCAPLPMCSSLPVDRSKLPADGFCPRESSLCLMVTMVHSGGICRTFLLVLIGLTVTFVCTGKPHIKPHLRFKLIILKDTKINSLLMLTCLLRVQHNTKSCARHVRPLSINTFAYVPEVNDPLFSQAVKVAPGQTLHPFTKPSTRFPQDGVCSALLFLSLASVWSQLQRCSQIQLRKAQSCPVASRSQKRWKSRKDTKNQQCLLCPGGKWRHGRHHNLLKNVTGLHIKCFMILKDARFGPAKLSGSRRNRTVSSVEPCLPVFMYF